MSGQAILSDIFERSLSLDSKKNGADLAMSLWEDMARSLDEIAANTRHGLQKTVVALTGDGTSKRGAAGGSLLQRKEAVIPGKRDRVTSAHAILAVPKIEGKKTEPRKRSDSPVTAQALSGKDPGNPVTLPDERTPKAKPTPGHTPPVVQAADAAAPTGNRNGLLSGQHSGVKQLDGGQAGKTKSQESLERARNEADGKAQAQTIADTLKQNLAKWDGSSIVGDSGDVEEAAGLAAGGPIYAAVKEVTGALESKGEDDNSLTGILRKTLEDKTGVTAVKEKAASAKDGLKSRIQEWAGKQDAAQADEKKAKRDKKGRFIRPAPDTNGKEQTELATQSFDLEQREAKENKKRHQELVRAVRSIDGGGGLLDNVLDGFGGRGGRGRDGRDARAGRGSKGGRDSRIGGGRAGRAGRLGSGRAGGRAARSGGRLARLGSRLGGVGSRILGAGAGLLSIGGLVSGAGAAEAATSAVAGIGAGRAATGAAGNVAARAAPRATTVAAESASRSTGLLGKVGSVGAKAGALGTRALGGMARAIPVIGQVLAVGMAVADGVQGWNDTEMHQAAFGLADGEEATTGQKASAATANVLDMGGLLTGLAGLAGFEIDTADIASGIYTAGSTVTGTVVEAWDAVGGTISTASTAAGAAISQAWDAASAGISEAASGAWSAISTAATTAWDTTSTAVAEATTDAWDTVTEGTAKAWETASSTASSALAATGEAVSSAWDSTSSAVEGAVTDAWDSVSSGAASAWSGVTDFFSGSKPEENAANQPQAEQTSPVVVQAVAAEPATTLLGAPKPDAAQARKGDKEDDSELGIDAVVVPDEEMEGLFGTLTEAVSGLSQTIRDEIKRKELENGGIFSAVGGIFSGVSSWVNATLSSSGGRGGGSTGTQSSSGGTSRRYTYDPNAKIGEAIAKYESGTGGSSTIGYDSTGGTSYGKYQLASKADSMEGFLKMMEGKGGEHAAIAARLRAAGPANTGSKNGAMPEQWKKEAAANGELLQSAELEYMLKANYAPAMQGLGDELRTKVEGSKALQEAMFSTAVQHGPGRTAGIWNKVYKEGMNDEDVIRAVYNERATRFGSSTPQVQASARNRMASEQELILSMYRGESSAQSVASAIQSSPQESKLRTAASASINATTQNAINRDVRYKMGSRDTALGMIDCSGLAIEQTKALMDNTNAALGKEVYGDKAKAILEKDGTAAGIIKNVGEATGGLLSGDTLSPESITEGMMIGLDASASAGADRFKGIDHIVQTFKDPKTGQMMVSESSSGDIEGKGRNGVMATPYDVWYAHQKKKGRAMYGADPTKLADASVLAETAVATSQPVEQKSAETSPVQVAQASTPPQQVAQAVPVASQPPTPAAPASPVATAAPNPRPQSVESVGDIAPPQNTGNNTMQTAGIEKLLQGILSVLTQQGKSNAQTGGEGPPHISMDFEDQTALGLAHDRA